MILGFKTTINNKETFFEQKIKRCFPPYKFLKEHNQFKPKIHTIREDKKERWHAGNLIHFTTGARTKNINIFLKDKLCVSTQTIEIKYNKKYDRYLLPDVLIDNKKLSILWLNILAINDGFDSVEDFFNYFPNDFKGKLIHWTDFSY
jgi:hypothetical protein